MKKKYKILIFLFCIPLILFILFSRMLVEAYSYAEHYQYWVKFSLLFIAIFGLIWSIKLSTKEKGIKNRVLLIIQVILLILLVVYTYIGAAIVNINF